MKIMRKLINGQISSEYAILFGIVTVALIAMQVYMNRGFSGRLKDAIDYPMTRPEANFSTSQYEPNYYFSSSLTKSNSQASEAQHSGGILDTYSETKSSIFSLEIINGTK